MAMDDQDIILTSTPKGTPTEGDDIFEVGPGSITALDGLGGNDTILLKPEGGVSTFYFGISSGVRDFTNIETLQGSVAAETINIAYDLLVSLKKIDGGGGNDVVNISDLKSLYDLRGLDIGNVSIDVGSGGKGAYRTIKVDKKETALLAHAHYSDDEQTTLDIADSGVTLTLSEIDQLFAQGFSDVHDARGFWHYSRPSIGNLDREQVFEPTNAPILLDAGQDAAVTVVPGDAKLEMSATGTFGFLAGGPVSVSVTPDGVKHVWVDLTDDGVNNPVDVGTLAVTKADGTIIQFNPAENIAQVVRAVLQNATIQSSIDSTKDKGEGVYSESAGILLTDSVGRTSSAIPFTSFIYYIPNGSILLDPASSQSPATNGDDKFVANASVISDGYSLRGGEGVDTLYLKGATGFFDLTALSEFSGIERIVFDRDGGILSISAAQLAGVHDIVATQNSAFESQIWLSGPGGSTFDLRGKVVSGDCYIIPNSNDATLVLSDKNLLFSSGSAALRHLTAAAEMDGDFRIHLVGDTFTADERAALSGNGVTIDLWDDSDDGVGNAAPMIDKLQGDTSTIGNRQTVFLDQGKDGSASDDVRVRTITVSVKDGGAADLLSIATSAALSLPDGWVEGGAIAAPAGTSSITFAHVYDVGTSGFRVIFNGHATQERIDALIHALTYTYQGDDGGWQRQIVIKVQDGADKASSATLTVNSNSPTSANNPPVWTKLDGDHVISTIGTPIAIDAGSDAHIIDDGTLKHLSVSVASADAQDLLNIATSASVSLSRGMASGSDITITDEDGAHIIGTLENVTAGSFDVALDEIAPALVDRLIHAITFTHLGGDAAWQKSITLGISDGVNPSVAATVTASGTPSDPGPVIPDPAKLAPVGLALTGATVAEFSPQGSLVGILSAIDPDAPAFLPSSLSYRLLDDAGGRFAIQNNQLKVAKSTLLDFEQATAHTVRVEVKDVQGLTQIRDFTIQVSNIEKERVFGTSDNEIIKGGRGNDNIFGGAGNDTLYGGRGKDVLRGDAGKDVFVFDTPPNPKTNIDHILSYSTRDDTIWLDDAVFRKIGHGTASHPAKLAAKAFYMGAQAHDADDRILYNPETGQLSYDQDGDGVKMAAGIAKLSAHLQMTASEFRII